MHILMFQTNINLINNFIMKLQREKVPIAMQEILIKIYADDLKFSLSDDMIQELLCH